MSIKFRPWTDEERKLLAGLIGIAAVGASGRLYSDGFEKIRLGFPHRSKASLYHEIYRLRKTGVAPKDRSYRPWSDDEIALLRTLYAGSRWRLSLETHFPGRPRGEIHDKARQLGLTRRQLRTEAKKLTAIQAASVACLIMGDGCLNHRVAGQGQKQHINTIAFTNTDVAIVELFASMASNCNVRRYESRPNSGFKSNKPRYEADICSREAVTHMLHQITPYLVGEKLLKAKQMLLCLNGMSH